jgi:hypothetical protein
MSMSSFSSRGKMKIIFESLVLMLVTFMDTIEHVGLLMYESKDPKCKFSPILLGRKVKSYELQNYLLMFGD